MNKDKKHNSFTSMLQVSFIVLKLTNVIDWPWFWVLSPFWIVFLFGIVEYYLIVLPEKKKQQKLKEQRKGFNSRIKELMKEAENQKN